MEDPNHDEPPSRARKVFGFSLSFLLSVVLTVLAVPLLFNAVCMPMTDGHPTGYFHLPWLRPDWVFVLYIVGGLAGTAVLYRRTMNPGVRAGCVTAVVLLIGLTLFTCHH